MSSRGYEVAVAIWLDLPAGRQGLLLRQLADRNDNFCKAMGIMRNSCLG